MDEDGNHEMDNRRGGGEEVKEGNGAKRRALVQGVQSSENLSLEIEKEFLLACSFLFSSPINYLVR